MTKLRLVLLATTALTAMQFASNVAHAQSAPTVIAQAKEELGPDGKPKQPPKGGQPPAKGAPPAPPAKPAAPPPPPAAKPPAPPPPPPAPPKPAAPPPPPPPHAAPPAPPPPPPAAKPAPPPPPPPPHAAPPAPPPPPPPAAKPATPPPAAAPQTTTPPAGGTPREERREGRPGTPPTTTTPNTAPVTPPPRTQAPTAPGTTPQAQPAPTASPSPTGSPPAGGALREERREGRPGGTPPGAPPTTTTPQQGAAPQGGTTPGRPGNAPAAGAVTPSPTPTTQPGRAQQAPGTPPGQAGQTPAQAPAQGRPRAATIVPSSPNAAPPPAQNAPPTVAPAFQAAPAVAAPLPPPPRHNNLTPLAIGAAVGAGIIAGATIEALHNQRQEVVEDGRTIYREPDRIIIRDPNGQEYVRGDDLYRFRYGARDIRTETVGGETRTVVIRPDGSEIITVVGADGSLLRRIRRDREGREIIIIDNTYRDPRAVGGFYVDLPPPVVRIPYDRYIVDAADAPPDVIYDTMLAPPVDRIDRRYSLDEIRYSPNVRMLMPSIDVNTINFELGSWEISPDQAAKLQVIADGLNRAIQRNPREVFLIEGHTDATGNDTDNLSLSDRRAQSAAELLTQQFQVPAENLTSQGYGSQYLKEQTDGPSRINRRVTIRRITPLLTGANTSLPPPPPGIAPPR